MFVQWRWHFSRPQTYSSIVTFDLQIRLYTLCNFTKHTPHTSGSAFIKPKQTGMCWCGLSSRCFCKFQGREGEGCNSVRTKLRSGWLAERRANSWVCSLPEAPVANTFPPVTQSHVRQENENCYCSGSLYLNQRRANVQLGQRNAWIMKTSAPPPASSRRTWVHCLNASKMSNM